MRFYLDENFPILAAEKLAHLGHEVFRAIDLYPAGTDDKTLFEDSQSRGAVFLTTDKDFFHTIPYLVSSRRAAVVAITLSQANSLNITTRLEALLAAVSVENETESVFLVTDRKILKRK